MGGIGIRFAQELIRLLIFTKGFSMSNTTKNYYEVMQLSSNATPETIERMFRFLASQHHPDVGGDRETFNELTKAFEVLRDPESKAAYDEELKQNVEENSRLVEHSKQAGPDAAVRHELLCLFYARRRQSIKNPSMGAVAIEQVMDMPADVLEFHTWYFKEKGWIQRSENGGFSITAAGVDQVEASELKLASQLRIHASTQHASDNVLVSA